MKYGSDIPGARKLLEQVLETDLYEDQHELIVAALEKMHRTPRARRTRDRNILTPAKISEIERLVRTTDLANSQIATAVGCNPGRVSEVIHGRRS